MSALVMLMLTVSGMAAENVNARFLGLLEKTDRCLPPVRFTCRTTRYVYSVFEPERAQDSERWKWWMDGNKSRREVARVSTDAACAEILVPLYTITDDRVEVRLLYWDDSGQPRSCGVSYHGVGLLDDGDVQRVFGRFLLADSIEQKWRISNRIEDDKLIADCIHEERYGRKLRYELALDKGGFVVRATDYGVNDVSFVIETQLAQWGPESNWFPRLIRCYHQIGERRQLKWETVFEDVEFHPEITEKTFKLELPTNIKRYDSRVVERKMFGQGPKE